MSISETPLKTSFYITGGTLPRDAPSYVSRQADRGLHAGLSQGHFCYVLTARQMGKSSLMVRTATRLREEGVAVVVLDLTAIGQNLTAEQWYDGLLSRIGQQLDLEEELEEFWLSHSRLAPLLRWTRAIEEVVLRRYADRVVIFIDEIDAVRSLPFSTDEFFAAIREFYNRRTEDPKLGRLTFCLLGVATPSDLIRDTRTTPFNIGQRIELNDFSEAEAAPLAKGLRREGKLGNALLQRILYWTGGHPYLTQRLCQAVAEDTSVSNAAGVDRLCEELFLSHRAQERDDNLLFVRERMLRSEADLASLLDLYKQVHKGKRVPDDETNPLVSILRLSGITRVEKGYLRVRNRIYARVFDQKWVVANMPDAELRRQRAAERRGLLRAAAISAVIVLVLLAGIVATMWQARIARAQRAEAERRFNDVRKLANSFLFEFHDAIKDLPGSTPARQLVVNKALEYLDGLARAPRVDPSLQSELAAAYERVGDVQGNPYQANLGDTAGALQSYRKALAIREALVAADPTNAPARRELSLSYTSIATMLGVTGDMAGSLENYRKALVVREALSAADPTNARARRDLAVSYAMVGDTLAWIGDTTAAMEDVRKSLAILEALSAADPSNARARRDVAIGYEKLGDILAARGDAAAALENFRKSLAIEEPMSAADPTNAKLRRGLAFSYNKVGDMLLATGDKAGALDSYRKALAISEALSASDPMNAQARRDLSISYNKVGDALAAAGDKARALQSYRKALTIREGLSAADPTSAQARRDLTVCYERIGDMLLAAGDKAGALESYRKALTIREGLSAADSTNTEARRDLAVSCANLGEVYVKLASDATVPAGKRIEHWRAARAWYQRSLDIYVDMRARGTLKGSDARLPDEMASEIAKVDAALAKLH